MVKFLVEGVMQLTEVDGAVLVAAKNSWSPRTTAQWSSDQRALVAVFQRAARSRASSSA